MKRNRGGQKRRARRSTASEPPVERGHRRWGFALAIAAVLGLAAVIPWYIGSQPDPALTPDRPPISLGEPPVDAARVLQLPKDPPETVQGCNEESLAAVQLLVKTLPERPESHAQMAFANLQLGQDQAALNSWRDAAACDKTFAVAYLGMGAILKEAGKNTEAIEALRRAIQLSPDEGQAYRELIEALLREGMAEEALPVAQECARRFPSVCENHFWLGQTYVQLRDYAEARQAHEEAVRINPEFTLSYYPLTIACAHLGQDKDAAGYRKRFTEVKSIELQRDRNRAREFDDFLTQRQALVKRHVLAGTLQLQYGDVRIAEAHWVRAAAIDPGDLATRKALVSLYDQQNRAGAELAFLDELIRIDPDNSTHSLRKAQLLVATHSWSEAEQTLTRELDSHPNSAEAHLLLADMYLRSGSDLRAAETHAEDAIRLAASSPGLLLLAAIREERGDRSGAVSALKRALSLDPTNAQVRQTYEQLLEME